MDKIKRLVLNPLTYAVLVVPVLLVVIWQVPQWQTSSVKFSTPDKQAEVENAYRTTLIQALGGTFLFVTAYFSWRNLKATEEKQITERYSKSIEQLGDDKIEVRLGGIYALERIAKDSPKDQWTIMEVLTSFVQEKSPVQENKNNQEEESETEEKKFPKITKDVQAALTVIRRRDASKDPEDKSLDLSKAVLSGANLSEAVLLTANLSEVVLLTANLSGAKLNKANLNEANLTGANLNEANLIGANLIGANLIAAKLIGAKLNEAKLLTAKLGQAILIGANLREADLYRADLGQAILMEADLRGADLRVAILYRADLSGADLSGADLRGAKELTLEQVKSAKYWEEAKYNPEFREVLGLPPESTIEEQGN